MIVALQPLQLDLTIVGAITHYRLFNGRAWEERLVAGNSVFREAAAWGPALKTAGKTAWKTAWKPA